MALPVFEKKTMNYLKRKKKRNQRMRTTTKKSDNHHQVLAQELYGVPLQWQVGCLVDLNCAEVQCEVLRAKAASSTKKNWMRSDACGRHSNRMMRKMRTELV